MDYDDIVIKTEPEDFVSVELFHDPSEPHATNVQTETKTEDYISIDLSSVWNKQQNTTVPIKTLKSCTNILRNLLNGGVTSTTHGVQLIGEPSNESAESPIPSRPKPKVKCTLCGLLFGHKGNLRVHLNNMHATVTAPPSGVQLTDEPSNESANRIPYRSKTYPECSLCGLFFTKSSLKRHLRTIHIQHPISTTAPLSGMQLIGKPSVESAKIPILSSPKTNPRCLLCGVLFSTKSSLTRHLHTIHASSRSKTVTASSSGEIGLNLPVGGSGQERPNAVSSNDDARTCYDCRMTFLDDFTYCHHMQNHQTVCIVCPFCKITQPQILIYDHVMETHEYLNPTNTVGSFYCWMCLRIFVKYTNLQAIRHLKSHDSYFRRKEKYQKSGRFMPVTDRIVKRPDDFILVEPCLRCFCGRQFLSDHALEEHVDSHLPSMYTGKTQGEMINKDKQKPLKCRCCQRIFPNISKFNRHLAIYCQVFPGKLLPNEQHQQATMNGLEDINNRVLTQGNNPLVPFSPRKTAVDSVCSEDCEIDLHFNAPQCKTEKHENDTVDSVCSEDCEIINLCSNEPQCKTEKLQDDGVDVGEIDAPQYSEWKPDSVKVSPLKFDTTLLEKGEIEPSKLPKNVENRVLRVSLCRISNETIRTWQSGRNDISLVQQPENKNSILVGGKSISLTCSICGVKHVDNASLKHHMDSHKDGAKFFCPDCPKNFKRLENIIIHMKTHKKEGLYKCDKCLKTFSRLFNFNNHLRSHENDKFLCAFCKKEFVWKNSLRLHVNAHLLIGKKEIFDCKICGKTYSRERDVLLHAVVHFKKKYYQCELCSKEFFRKSSLSRHERKHTGSILCHVCNKTFDRKIFLNQHKCTPMKSKCQSCNKLFLTAKIHQHLLKCLGKLKKFNMSPVVMLEKINHRFIPSF